MKDMILNSIKAGTLYEIEKMKAMKIESCKFKKTIEAYGGTAVIYDVVISHKANKFEDNIMKFEIWMYDDNCEGGYMVVACYKGCGYKE